MQDDTPGTPTRVTPVNLTIPAAATAPFLSQAEVLSRLVKPTYVGSHRRPDSVEPDERIFRRLVQRDTMRALTVGGKFSVFGEPTRHAAPCVLHPHDNPPCFTEHHLDEP